MNRQTQPPPLHLQVVLTGAGLAGAAALQTASGAGAGAADVSQKMGNPACAHAPGAPGDNGWRIMAARPRQESATQPPESGPRPPGARTAGCSVDSSAQAPCSGQHHAEPGRHAPCPAPGVPLLKQPRAVEASQNRHSGAQSAATSASQQGTLRLPPRQAAPAAQQACAGVLALPAAKAGQNTQQAPHHSNSSSAGAVIGVRTEAAARGSARAPQGEPASSAKKGAPSVDGGNRKLAERALRARPAVPKLDTDVGVRKSFSFAHKGCAQRTTKGDWHVVAPCWAVWHRTVHAANGARGWP